MTTSPPAWRTRAIASAVEILNFGTQAGLPFFRNRSKASLRSYSADLFKTGEKVHVSGLMKGRGFAGVVKRHGFSGGKDTHGCKSHRVPGSIGTSAWPSRVIKGRKLPGRFGNTRKTTKNLKIFDVQGDSNLILIKGSVPGGNNGLVEIQKISA